MSNVDKNTNSVAGNIGNMLHDATELAELQGQLFMADISSVVRRAIVSFVLLSVALCLVLGSVTIALLSLSELLADQWNLSTATASGIAAFCGMIVAGFLGGLGFYRLRDSFSELERSRSELKRNIAWVKRSFRGETHYYPRQKASA